MARWYDLADPQARLRFVKDPSTNSVIFAILGVDRDSVAWNQCLSPVLGFAVPKGTTKPILTRRFTAREGLKLAALRTAFPGAREITIGSADEVRLKLNDSPQSAAERSAASALTNAALIGMNALGQRVYQTPIGERFAIDENGNRLEESTRPAANCLRGDDVNESLLAQGYVMGLMAGVLADANDVKRFVRVCYGDEAADDIERIERMNRLIKASMTARLIAHNQTAGAAAYTEAQQLYENSAPNQGVSKGGGAMPLPATVVVQEFARAFGSDRDQNLVYIPKLYDGGLASLLGPYVVYAEKPEAESREARMREMVPAHVTVFERGEGEPLAPHKISILNVENDSADTFADIATTLDARDEQGLTVIIAPSPGVTREKLLPAEGLSGVELFARTISELYEIEGLLQCAPVMRAKMGIDQWLNLLVVGRRFLPREVEARRDNVILQGRLDQVRKRVFDWDTMRSASNDVLAAVHEAAGHAWSAADRAALESAAEAANENRLQLPYQPFSQNGEAETMIPRNLAGATYEALQAVRDRVGSIDGYVRNAIGFTEEQYEYLAPEQVDAMALAISQLDAGGGFLLGDRTGVGKGVTLAGMVSYAWNRGLPVIFVTKQPSLFSDFYRDLKACGMQDQMRPLILNYNGDMVDQLSDDLTVVARGVGRESFKENYRFGLEAFGNPNLVLTTYSQFSKGEDAEKSDAVIDWSKRAIVIFDESHIAAGEKSNVGAVCSQIASNAIGVAYSSATSIKDASVISFYKRLLPQSMTVADVESAISVGGDATAETLINSLARDGRMIRRERNTSKVEITAVPDIANRRRNDDIANKNSLILQALQRLCGTTEQVGRRLTRDQVTKLDRTAAIIKSALDRVNGEIVSARERQRRARMGNVVVPREALHIAQNEADLAEANNQRFMLDNQPDAVADLQNLQATFDADGMRAEDAAADRIEAEAALRDVDTGQPFTAEELAARARAEQGRTPAEAAAYMRALGFAEAANDAQQVQAAPDGADRLDVLTLADFGFSEKEAKRIIEDVDSEDDDAMKRLKRQLKKIEAMTRKVSTRTASFGNFLFFSQRILNVALQSTFAGQRAVDHIRAGKKPIIFLEHTFEGALAEALESEDTIEQEDGTWIIQPPRLKDNLASMYKTLTRITAVDAEGAQHQGTIMDDRFRATEAEKQSVREGMDVLGDLIAQLPNDLYASPIDVICHAIRAAGYSVAEATGRKYEVREMRVDGSWVVGKRSKESRKISNIERAFNFGEADALVGNKAMSTGMSIHASEQFSDQSQRVTMFVQVFSDVNDYIQALGRADRRGQVIEPQVEMLSSGLPSEARVMMTHFTKIRRLLAATTSSRENEFETEDIIDLYNPLGDESVRDYLQANPGVGVRLGIPFSHYMPASMVNGKEKDHWYPGLAHFAVPRLDLFLSEESRAVFAELTHNFRDVQREYDMAGTNPLKTNVIDLSREDVAIVSAREDLMPARLNEHGDVTTVFDEAVELLTISSKKKYRAPTWDQILAKIEHETLGLRMHSAAQTAAGKKPDFIIDQAQPALYSAACTVGPPLPAAARLMPTGLRERITTIFQVMDVMMRSSADARKLMGDHAAATPARDENGDELETPHHLHDDKEVKVTPDQVLEARRAWLLTNIAHLVPGSWVEFDVSNGGWETRRRTGVITSLRLPPPARETNFARWQVTIQVPGGYEEHVMTLRDLYRSHFKPQEMWLPGVETLSDDMALFKESVPEFFDAYTRKAIDWETKRYVMGGNMFRAAAIAAGAKIGASGIVQFKSKAPMRVITCNNALTRREIFEKVPVDVDGQTAVGIFVNGWSYLNRPFGANANYYLSMLGDTADYRGLHTAKEARLAGMSMYWLPSKKGIKDRWASFSREEEAEEEVTADTDAVDQSEHNALAGLAVRYRGVDRGNMALMVASINLQLMAIGASPAKLENKANTTVCRVVVRFRSEGGARESTDVITEKLRIVATASTALYPQARYFPVSMPMRLIAMAASEKQYAAAKEARTQREEAMRMAAAAIRMHVSAEDMDSDAVADAALAEASAAAGLDDESDEVPPAVPLAA